LRYACKNVYSASQQHVLLKSSRVDMLNIGTHACKKGGD
jgi:hypothetical protein